MIKRYYIRIPAVVGEQELAEDHELLRELVHFPCGVVLRIHRRCLVAKVEYRNRAQADARPDASSEVDGGCVDKGLASFIAIENEQLTQIPDWHGGGLGYRALKGKPDIAVEVLVVHPNLDDPFEIGVLSRGKQDAVGVLVQCDAVCELLLGGMHEVGLGLEPVLKSIPLRLELHLFRTAHVAYLLQLNNLGFLILDLFLLICHEPLKCLDTLLQRIDCLAFLNHLPLALGDILGDLSESFILFVESGFLFLNHPVLLGHPIQERR